MVIISDIVSSTVGNSEGTYLGLFLMLGGVTAQATFGSKLGNGHGSSPSNQICWSKVSPRNTLTIPPQQ